MGNRLCYGDNLEVLRASVKDESVDLVYLDPPFNSNATYNILFAPPKALRTGQDACHAQIQAFEDSWHWNDAAEDAFDQVARSGLTRAFELLDAMRRFLGENDMMAYLAMMAVRLIELHRVLRPTGSLYLHCDPTASHYLKLLLDSVFGADRYEAEIIWRRTNARSTSGGWPRLHDTILHYSRSARALFRPQTIAGEIARMPHTLITGADGLKYNTFELTGAGVTRDGESGRPWRGFDPARMGRHWGYNVAQLEAWTAAGLIHFPAGGGFPRRRAEMPFVTAALPTSAMEKEAAAVGRFHSDATGRSYARLQILTLAELFQGRRPDIPLVDSGAAFRRAGREETGRQARLL